MQKKNNSMDRAEDEAAVTEEYKKRALLAVAVAPIGRSLISMGLTGPV